MTRVRPPSPAAKRVKRSTSASIAVKCLKLESTATEKDSVRKNKMKRDVLGDFKPNNVLRRSRRVIEKIQPKVRKSRRVKAQVEKSMVR